MPEPAVVFGACGVLGRPLVRALAGAGRPVVAVGRCPPAADALPGVTWVPSTPGEPGAWRQFLAGASVFHLAAVRSRPGTAPAEHRRFNVETTLALAEECARAPVARWIHVSTARVYGPQAVPGDPGPGLWSEAPSSYVRSRVECLLALRARLGAGLPLVVVCPTVVFGPDTPQHPNRITNHLRRLLRTRLSVRVGRGGARRNLVYVDDVVAGILAAEGRAEVGDELLLAGEDVSPAEFDALAFRLAGRRPHMRLRVPRALAGLAAGALDAVRRYHADSGYAAALRTLQEEWRFPSGGAEHRLGYRPRPLADGLRSTLAFLAPGRGRVETAA